jgi:hypothetical protein
MNWTEIQLNWMELKFYSIKVQLDLNEQFKFNWKEMGYKLM